MICRFCCLILPPRGLAVKHRFSIGQQRGQLILKPDDGAVGFAKTLAFARDAFLQPGPLLMQLGGSRVGGQPDRPVPG